jgi:hypothetical protein
MSRTDDFEEEEICSSYKDYSQRILKMEEWHRVSNIIREIPRDSTFDRDAQDRGLESSDVRDREVQVRAQEYFKQWIGRVVEIEDSDNFVAKIESLRSRGNDQKIVRFNRHKVSIANLEQFEEGAVFYWTVGVFQNKHKMMVKRSEIRFQMLNAPSPILIKEMENEIGKVFDGISWLE